MVFTLSWSSVQILHLEVQCVGFIGINTEDADCDQLNTLRLPPPLSKPAGGPTEAMKLQKAGKALANATV